MSTTPNQTTESAAIADVLPFPQPVAVEDKPVDLALVIAQAVAVEKLLPKLNRALEQVHILGAVKAPDRIDTPEELEAASQALVYHRGQIDSIKVDFEEFCGVLNRSHKLSTGMRARFLKPHEDGAFAYAAVIADLHDRETARVAAEELALAEAQQTADAAAEKRRKDDLEALEREAAEAEALGDTEAATELIEQVQEIEQMPVVSAPVAAVARPAMTMAASLPINMNTKPTGKCEDMAALLVAAASPRLYPAIAQRLIEAGQKDAGMLVLSWATQLPDVPISGLFEVKQKPITDAVSRRGHELNWPGVVVTGGSKPSRKPGQK